MLGAHAVREINLSTGATPADVEPWYTSKPHESFANMLGTLRSRSLRESISAWAPHGPGSQKIIKLVEDILALAA